MYSATRSRIFSTSSGSGETLKLSWRQGFSPKARQISATVQAQIEAFDDTWTWSQQAETRYDELVRGPSVKVADALEAMRRLVGDPTAGRSCAVSTVTEFPDAAVTEFPRPA